MKRPGQSLRRRKRNVWKSTEAGRKLHSRSPFGHQEPEKQGRIVEMCIMSTTTESPNSLYIRKSDVDR